MIILSQFFSKVCFLHPYSRHMDLCTLSFLVGSQSFVVKTSTLDIICNFFQQIIFILDMLILGIRDLNHFILLLVTLTLVGITELENLDLYSHPKEFLGNGVRSHVNSKGKFPSTGSSEECASRDAASHKTASPIHYWLSCSSQWFRFTIPPQEITPVFRT